jgi:hypothetical protein
MQRQPNNPKLIAGARVRLSPLGIERSRKLRSRTGVIVRMNPGRTSFRILFDGRKLPVTPHESVEPEEEQRPFGPAQGAFAICPRTASIGEAPAPKST